MRKTCWKIQGYDGGRKILERTVPIGYFSTKQIEHLLKALAAAGGLNANEIIGAYAKRRTKIANDLLSIHWDMKHKTVMCGDDPHYTAKMVEVDL